MRYLICVLLLSLTACGGGSGDGIASDFRSAGFCEECVGDIRDDVNPPYVDVSDECIDDCFDECEEEDFDEFDELFGTPLSCPASRRCQRETCAVCESGLECATFTRTTIFDETEFTLRCAPRETDECTRGEREYERF